MTDVPPADALLAPVQPPLPPAKMVIPPAPGEVITSLATGNSYTMGEKALRRHVAFRTATAMELWRDLNALAEIPPAAEVKTEDDSDPAA